MAYSEHQRHQAQPQPKLSITKFHLLHAGLLATAAATNTQYTTHKFTCIHILVHIYTSIYTYVHRHVNKEIPEIALTAITRLPAASVVLRQAYQPAPVLQHQQSAATKTFNSTRKQEYMYACMSMYAYRKN